MTIPYLSVDPREVDAWRSRLAAASNKLRVGIAWAGRREHRNDQSRSMRLEVLVGALKAVEGIQFFSLQKGAPSAELKNAATPILDYTEELHDFLDTATLIGALDLVISVDTAVVHLAGALGKPVWMLNRFDTCWRWLMEREDTPWYPTLRLFRQPRFRDWEPVVHSVAAELSRVVKERVAGARETR